MGKFNLTQTWLTVVPDTLAARGRRRASFNVVGAFLALCVPTLAYAQSITVSPSEGPAGQSVVVNGTAWISAQDNRIGIDIVGTSGRLARVLPNAGGNFAVAITIPRSSAPGPVQIEALGSVNAFTSYTATPPQSPGPCVDAYFIGVHGVEEGPDSTSSKLPNSPELMETWNTFSRNVSTKDFTKTMDYSLLSYHAPPFKGFPSALADLATLSGYIDDGVSRLINLTNRIIAQCPTQNFVLVGFSFGAWVIDEWLSRIDVNSQIWRQILAVQLYGDPLWYHNGQDGIHQGLARALITHNLYPSLNPDPYTNNPPGPGGSISAAWASLCLKEDPVCGEGQWSDDAQQLASARDCVDSGCEHLKYTRENYIDRHPDYPTYDITTRGANFLVSKAFPSPANNHNPDVTQVSTYQEEDLVFFSLLYSDPDNDAAGFGFRGTNGGEWAQETHPFTNPSYGRVSPGRIDYPFNLLCSTGASYQSDVQAWIYDSTGRTSPMVTAHLACAAPTATPSVGTVPFPWYTLGGIAR